MTAGARLNDEFLIAQFLSGDDAAFNALVRRWHQKIYNFVVRYVSDSDEASDLTQRTFIRTYTGLRRLDDVSRFPSWIYRIALNTCRDAARSTSRYPTVSTSDEAVASFLVTDASSHPDVCAHAEQVKEMLSRALQAIPEEQRVVVIMKEYQGLKFREIAETLEIPINTVKSRMYYGLKALRKVFDSWNVTKEMVWYDA